MNEIICLYPDLTEEIECECLDGKPCNIQIDDGGNLVCRHGSNEGIIKGIATVVCPIEIDSEQVKWKEFLRQEIDPK